MKCPFNPSKCTQTWSSEQPTLQRSWGLPLVADNSCRSRDSDTQPRVTSPMLYPLGHGCPVYVNTHTHTHTFFINNNIYFVWCISVTVLDFYFVISFIWIEGVQITDEKCRARLTIWWFGHHAGPYKCFQLAQGTVILDGISNYP